jgi:alpha-tubulin suppressor-like RCC1 family protein
MTILDTRSKLLASGVCVLWLALAGHAQSPTLGISPTDPTISVGGIQQFTSSGAVTPTGVSAGGEYTCVDLSDGTVRCVGRNQYGQHANGTSNNFSSVLGPSELTNVNRVVAGDEFVCALLRDTTVKCWALGESGQLGDGTFTQYSPAPVAVSGLTGATALAGGYGHACALLADGSMRCWGGNIHGELGNGTTADPTTGPPGSALPVAVTGIADAIAITTGAYHTCAVLSDGTARCWGINHQGQLGDGTRTSSSIPVAVEGLANVAAISGGGVHTCAVLADRTVWCWGENEFGQLGDGTTATATTPVQVVGISDAVAVVTGWRHACALLADSTARCWGQNEFGQLGDGSIAHSSIPVPVSALTGAVGLTAGWWHHSCALLANGSVKCWGMNDWGQLGDGTTSTSAISTPVTMVGAGITWTSSHPTVATIDGTGRAIALDSGATTITATDTSGASASTTLTVRQRAALSVIRAGTGTGGVTSSPSGINCGTQCAALFDVGTTVTLTASADSRSTFAGWSGCDAVSGDTCTVTVNAATTVTATFELKRFTLTVNRAGVLGDLGTVSSTQPGISCGTDCSESYAIDTVVTLTASPDLLFSGWSGCDAVSGPSCTVTMTSARSVTASFLAVPE